MPKVPLTNKNDLPKEIVFIVGAPRSGTTLVLNMLAVNQQAIGGIPRESKFYTKFYGQALNLDELHSHRYFNLMFPDKNELEAILDSSATPLQFFKLAISRWCHREDVEIFVEKTPQHVFHWKQIQRDFPNATFLIVRRNHAANIHSIVKTSFISNPAEMIPLGLGKTRLLQHLGAILKYDSYRYEADRLAKSVSCINVCYEDIVNGDTDLRSIFRDRYHIQMDELFVRRPFSDEAGHKRYEIDSSRTTGFENSMPLFAQKLIVAIYQPNSMVSHTISVLFFAIFSPTFRAFTALKRELAKLFG